MKTGIAVQYCPSCAHMQRHRLAMVGEEVFAACHVCHTVSVLEDDDPDWAPVPTGPSH